MMSQTILTIIIINCLSGFKKDLFIIKLFNRFNEILKDMSSEKSLKALVMTTSQEDQIKLSFITTDFLKDEKVTVTETFYDEFQEGSKKNRFDCIVAPLFSEECTADDVEMMEEFYQHYAGAPIFTWVVYKVEEMAELKKFLSSLVPQS